MGNIKNNYQRLLNWKRSICATLTPYFLARSFYVEFWLSDFSLKEKTEPCFLNYMSVSTKSLNLSMGVEVKATATATKAVPPNQMFCLHGVTCASKVCSWAGTHLVR